MANDIGNITASLKLESAAFIRELTKASQATAKNTSAMQKSMAGLNKSFAGVVSNLKGMVAGFIGLQGVRILANLGQDAIDMADKMGKAAQALGLTTEAMSRLTYAAKINDIASEELVGGITKMNKALVEAQKNAASPAAQAFEALGINLEKLKTLTPEEAINEIAEAYQRFDDGAGKAAISATLFGRSLGAKMIPFLNAGSESLKELGDEAERFGVVVSDEAAQQADQFNDNIDRLGVLAMGAAHSLTQDFLPAINNLLEAYIGFATSEPEKNVESFFDKLTTGAANAALRLIPVYSLLQSIKLIGEALETPAGPAGPGVAGGVAGAAAAAAGTPPGGEGGEDELTKRLRERAAAIKGASAAQSELNRIEAEGQQVFEATRTPLEAYNVELERLGVLLGKRAIDAETFGRAQQMAAASAISPWLMVAETVGGALGTLFEDNKAVAIAQAIINTAQGITAALAQYPPPLSFAMAAAQAAAGAAQIATIKSTRVGGGGSARRPSAGGGSGAAVAATTATPVATGPDRSVLINLTGRGLLSAEQVRGVIEQLVDAQKDGARLVLAQP